MIKAENLEMTEMSIQDEDLSRFPVSSRWSANTVTGKSVAQW